VTGALAPPRLSPTLRPLVRRLTPADVTALRLPGLRSAATMREALAQGPERSLWIPETLEYALVGMWRNRPEIASVDELVAVRNVEPLLRSAFELCVERGDELLLVIELESQRGRSRFERAGMELLEEVITYEIDIAQVRLSTWSEKLFLPLRPGDTSAIERVTKLDQDAFPWLWRNSQREFAAYIGTPGVDVYVLEFDGLPAAYVGTTLFSGWGHLDRIAVAPSLQGRGIGQAALRFAIEALRRKGARRIGLSTQGTNFRSQRLYERFGFMRTPELDYQLFGYWRHPGIFVSQWDT
jgi:ribosomal protein S18 acetylase RimI-like enzyme